MHRSRDAAVACMFVARVSLLVMNDIRAALCRARLQFVIGLGVRSNIFTLWVGFYYEQTAKSFVMLVTVLVHVHTRLGFRLYVYSGYILSASISIIGDFRKSLNRLNSITITALLNY